MVSINGIIITKCFDNPEYELYCLPKNYVVSTCFTSTRGDTEARGATECYSATIRILRSSHQKFRILERKPSRKIRLCIIPLTGVINFNVHDVLKSGELRNLSAVG